MAIRTQQIKPGTDGQVMTMVGGSWVGASPTGGTTSGYQMGLGGPVENGNNYGSEIAGTSTTLTSFRACRGLAGSSGTTTIELEVNGTATGDTLSWTNSDANMALKTASISESISAGDRISFRVTSSEVDAEDIFAEVN